MKTELKPFRSYALLGSGRLARHFHFYLKSLNLPLVQWSRNGDPLFNTFSDMDPATRLDRVLESSSHVLLAVKDSAIQELARQILPSTSHQLIHFSGALNIDGAEGAHPLMTFGQNLEGLDWYRTIPFVLISSEENWELEDLLPGLPNPSYKLEPADRPYYHALCALAGNASFLLWRKIGDEFESSLKLPRALLTPFLHQVVSNSSELSSSGFTGPVARGDWAVVRKHLDSLARVPELLEFYQQYLKLAQANGYPVPSELTPFQLKEREPNL